MHSRISFARFLLKLGSYVQSLPLVVMRPDDLVEFSRQCYAKPADIESWTEDELVDSGLSADELSLLAELPSTSGDLLLLGIGGGREAIPMAKMGFRVTGVDYVAAMVDRAKENAARNGVHIEGLVQEISNLDTPSGAYDVVWLSRAMYSCVPTKARRIAMVRKIVESLKPNGFFVCQFHLDPRLQSSKKAMLLRRLVSIFTLGNLYYEEGDMLWCDIEFVHAFPSVDAARLEIEQCGLSVKYTRSYPNSIRAGIICRKNPAFGQS